MRGDVHRLPDDRSASGHERRGSRYGVVIQSSDLPLSTVLVSPTSTSTPDASWRPVVELQQGTTRVLTEQTKAVSRERLGHPIARISLSEQQAVDRALSLVFDLGP